MILKTDYSTNLVFIEGSRKWQVCESHCKQYKKWLNTRFKISFNKYHNRVIFVLISVDFA